MRRRIDITEVEAATKIRAKYLRALENEEWELLPGPTFVKTFLRTYADYLGLDAAAARRGVQAALRAPGGDGRHAAEPAHAAPRKRRVAPRIGPGARGRARHRRPARRALPARRLGRQRRAPSRADGRRDARRRRSPDLEGDKTKKQQEEAGDAGAADAACRSSPPARSTSAWRTRAGARSSTRRRSRPARRRARSAAGASRSPSARRRRGIRQNGKSYRVATSKDPVGYALRSGRRPQRITSGLAELHVSARAGIVVTGTEVLSGIISDRNGPWLAERLRERGVQLAHVMIVGDRPRDLRAALDFLAARGHGPDRHQRRPRADRRRPDRRGRRGLRRPRAAPRRGAGGPDRGDPRAAARALARRSTRTRCAPATASRRWCPRARRCSSRSGRRPAWSCPRTAPTVVVLPGPPASCSRCGTPRSRPRRCRPRWPAPAPTSSGSCACSGCPSPRSPRRCARSRRDGVPLERLEITTCLRRGEIEIATVFEPDGRRRLRRVRGGGPRAPRRRRCSRATARRSTSWSRRAARPAGPHRRGRGVVHRRPDGGAADRPRRLLRLRAGRRHGRTPTRPRSRSRACDAELIERHGAVSPEVAAALADGASGALRRGRRDRHHRDRRPGRRHRGQAGRDGLPVGGRARAARGSTAPCSCPATARRSASGPTTVAMHLLRRLLDGCAELSASSSRSTCPQPARAALAAFRTADGGPGRVAARARRGAARDARVPRAPARGGRRTRIAAVAARRAPLRPRPRARHARCCSRRAARGC